MERKKKQQQAECIAPPQKPTFCQQIQQYKADWDAAAASTQQRKKHAVVKRNQAYWQQHLQPLMSAQTPVLRERSSASALGYGEGQAPVPIDSPLWRPDVVAWEDDVPVPRSSFQQVRPEERPREKMVERGPQALADAELLALMLDTGLKGVSVLELAQNLLDRFGGLAGMQSLGLEELTSVHGLGRAKATRILAGFELCRRSNMQRRQQRNFRNSAETANFLRPLVADLSQEVFYVVYLNYANRVITERKVSMGGITATIADPVLIFRTAMQVQAVKLIVCHNHPSGDFRPSGEDINVTNRIAKMGEVLGVQLLDHLIVTSDGYFSFADHNMIKAANPETRKQKRKAGARRA